MSAKASECVKDRNDLHVCNKDGREGTIKEHLKEAHFQILCYDKEVRTLEAEVARLSVPKNYMDEGTVQLLIDEAVKREKARAERAEARLAEAERLLRDHRCLGPDAAEHRYARSRDPAGRDSGSERGSGEPLPTSNAGAAANSGGVDPDDERECRG